MSDNSASIVSKVWNYAHVLKNAGVGYGDYVEQITNFKEVTADETTLRFWQEIYDDTLRLVEIHEKFPVDRGHQKV